MASIAPWDLARITAGGVVSVIVHYGDAAFLEPLDLRSGLGMYLVGDGFAFGDAGIVQHREVAGLEGGQGGLGVRHDLEVDLGQLGGALPVVGVG